MPKCRISCRQTLGRRRCKCAPFGLRRLPESRMCGVQATSKLSSTTQFEVELQNPSCPRLTLGSSAALSVLRVQ